MDKLRLDYEKFEILEVTGITERRNVNFRD